jgi:hypothetical protein
MKTRILLKKMIFILFLIFSSLLMSVSLIKCKQAPNVVIYHAPEGEIPSTDFKIQVDGNSVFVYQARVSAKPVDQVYTGYQRPKDQTEIASFAYFDISGQHSIEVKSSIAVKSVDIRPKSYGIIPVVDGNVIKFNLSRPCKIVVEVNGQHNALHLFANEIDKNTPDPQAQNMRYFGPGNYQVGTIKMKDNETIYIAGGAIVHGVIEARDVSNIKILGRGILDASAISRSNMVNFSGCSNVLMDGIILRDSPAWTIASRGCKDEKFSDLKIIGQWRYNTDGIDVCNSQKVIISDCFVRSFDDSIVLKGLGDRRNPNVKDSAAMKRFGYRRNQNVKDSIAMKKGSEFRSAPNLKDENVENIEVSNCVIWNDWGRPLEIGVESEVDSIGNIVFKNCDVIHYVHVAMDIQLGGKAVVHDVKYENIRVEEPIIYNGQISDYRMNLVHNYEPTELGKLIVMTIRKTVDNISEERGRVNNISFRNITYDGIDIFPQSVFEGFDGKHMVENVTFENIVINGRKINNIKQGNMLLNQYTNNIVFKL